MPKPGSTLTVHANALQWLAQQADGTYGLVSGFHIIEHLPFEQLFTLIAQAWRVLAPGGVLVLETPNPENVWWAAILSTTTTPHRNPITPTSLRFLLATTDFPRNTFAPSTPIRAVIACRKQAPWPSVSTATCTAPGIMVWWPANHNHEP
ncbi:MAG: hypothetical protein IPH35_10895 [Rhodoferax sp.]|nr:hypothetical protein [Rhodoferax sp.]